jgi:hypothetical protein
LVWAQAKNCLKVDDENSPAATLSGHITTRHKVHKNIEADLGAGCRDWVEIAINDESILGFR